MTAEIALALCEETSLEALERAPPPLPLAEALARLGRAPLPELAAGRLERLHFGNEFCERMVPSRRLLARALHLADRLGLRMSLGSPLVGDRALGALRRLFALLPERSEVVVNDLGVLRAVAQEFPLLQPVAGRQLCKMIKDPRLPNRTWTRLYPHGVGAPPFLALMRRFGVRRLEMDVPPFAAAEDFCHGELGVSVHVPYAYAVKGRICRIGSLGQPAARKFAPAHSCRRECLRYVCEMARGKQGAAADLATFQRGNTVFYRHSRELAAVVHEAAGRGWIDRIVVSGDWNEDHRAAQPG